MKRAHPHFPLHPKWFCGCSNMAYNSFIWETVVLQDEQYSVLTGNLRIFRMTADPPPNAIITNIQGFSIHDGPGIRTVVFFKGCPLSCCWCANPECISQKPQMGFLSTLCKSCGKCRDVCENLAISYGEGDHRIDYSLCMACGKCKESCYYGALVRYGDVMTVAEVWDAVRRDKIFYDTSGGGVTVSGGEPLLRPGFIRELFELCREEGINTCIETCGFADSKAFQEVFSVTDHFLFDLKLMDSDDHRRYTGAPNNTILKNAELLLKIGADVIFRQPLIPGINDSMMNIEATAEFLNCYGKGGAKLELMPYHRLGQSKYAALHMFYDVEGIRPMEDDQIEAVKKSYIARGIHCTISR
jgi:pyruvate formate lyase activating enzyme